MSCQHVVDANGEVVEITKEDYDEMWEALPPIQARGFWAMSEPYRHTDEGKPVYFWCMKWSNKYYSCLGTYKHAGEAFSKFCREKQE
jgi:hypothetical protein